MPPCLREYDRQPRVRFEWFATPVRIVGEGGVVRGVEFDRTSGPRLPFLPPSRHGGEGAIGQGPHGRVVEALPGIEHRGGRIIADPASGATYFTGLFAGGGGRCLRKGARWVTVEAVQDGTRWAARGIDAYAADP